MPTSLILGAIGVERIVFYYDASLPINKVDAFFSIKM